MRKFMESGFYVIYLVLMIGIGLILIRRGKEKKPLKYFGLACVILGCGDAFHLIPRAVGLFTGTLDAPGAALAAWLGIGKLITSITMTVYYLLMYFFVFARRGLARNRALDIAVCALVIVRIALCAFPQNDWVHNASVLSWGIIRNVPFVILGVLFIVLAYAHLRKTRPYRLLWLAVTLSFAFYLPVVLFAAEAGWVGMMMLPKTLCYLWILFMGQKDSHL